MGKIKCLNCGKSEKVSIEGIAIANLSDLEEMELEIEYYCSHCEEWFKRAIKVAYESDSDTDFLYSD
jgi:formate dehydrogenase maturation protein FdhE